MIIGQKYKRIKDDETNDREKDNSIPAFGFDNVELGSCTRNEMPVKQSTSKTKLDHLILRRCSMSDIIGTVTSGPGV